MILENNGYNIFGIFRHKSKYLLFAGVFVRKIIAYTDIQYRYKDLINISILNKKWL
jgi:hypothetical protein